MSREDDLARFLAEWRELDPATPQAVAYEDRILELGRAIGRPRIKAKRGEDIEELWHAVADDDDPADVDRLMDAPLAATGADAARRIAKLQARPRDPRIALGLVRWVPTYTSTYRWPSPQWTMMALLRPPRSERVERALSEMLDTIGDGEYRARCIQALEATPRSQLTRINLAPALRAPVTPDVATLVAQHTADPGNLELRAVLADALVEAGDPRGELIQLQLAIAAGNRDPAAAARAAELLARHADTWGDVPHLEGGRRFERGFLVAARCSVIDDLALASPVWNTVEELVVERVVCGLPALLERMPLLRALATTGLDRERTALAAAGPYPHIRALAFRDAAGLRDASMFPNLEVAVGIWGYTHGLPAAPVHAYVGVQIGAMQRAFARRGQGVAEVRYVVSRLRDVRFDPHGWIVAVPRDGTRARMAWVAGAPYEALTTAAILEALASASIHEVAVHAPDHMRAAIEVDVARAIAGIGGIVADFEGRPISVADRT